MANCVLCNGTLKKISDNKAICTKCHAIHNRKKDTWLPEGTLPRTVISNNSIQSEQLMK